VPGDSNVYIGKGARRKKDPWLRERRKEEYNITTKTLLTYEQRRQNRGTKSNKYIPTRVQEKALSIWNIIANGKVYARTNENNKPLQYDEEGIEYGQ
jgi:predicted nucleotidyltransferase